MSSSPSAETKLRARIRQQEGLAELGEQALETDDVDRLLRDAVTTVVDTLETDYCGLLDRFPGGDVWVDSAPGEGSTFSFTLPAESDTNE